MSDLQTALCIVCLLIAPLACAGLALINTGLGRARSAAHTMTASLCLIAVSACVYAIAGHSWQGFPGGVACRFFLGGKTWDWLGHASPFFAGLPFDGSPAFLAAWMGIVAVSLTGLIPLGAGSERWRLAAILISTVVLSGWTFPLFAHWAWGGGWLAQLGFVDLGGSGTIHVVGGFTALSLAWLLGPRRGKFGYDGMPMAIPGHNAIYIIFGCLLSLVGWTGLNAAGALLFANVQAGRLVLIAVNTFLGAASGGLGAAAITRIRFGKPDSSLTANGWLGGLVAISATCAFLPPARRHFSSALGAGALVAFCVEQFELLRWIVLTIREAQFRFTRLAGSGGLPCRRGVGSHEYGRAVSCAGDWSGYAAWLLNAPDDLWGELADRSVRRSAGCARCRTPGHGSRRARRGRISGVCYAY